MASAYEEALVQPTCDRTAFGCDCVHVVAVRVPRLVRIVRNRALQPLECPRLVLEVIVEKHSKGILSIAAGNGTQPRQCAEQLCARAIVLARIEPLDSHVHCRLAVNMRV